MKNNLKSKQKKRDFYKYKAKDPIYDNVCDRFPTKALYKTRARAEEMIELHNKDYMQDHYELHIYKCGNHWHLTSQKRW